MVLTYQPLDLAQVRGTHRAAVGEADVSKPELALPVAVGDVYVRRFFALVGVEVEPEGSDSQDGRHDPTIRYQRTASSRRPSIYSVVHLRPAIEPPCP